jgi:23S rRNA G2445 N2-methylase RlmL
MIEGMDHPPRYILTVPTGLEFLAAEEVNEHLPDAAVQSGRGKLHVSTHAPVASLFALRSCFHVYAFAALEDNLPIEADGLDGLKAVAHELDWEPALALWRRCFDRQSPASFRITAQRHGDHAYSSMQAAAALGEAIQQRFGWPVNLNAPDLEIYAQLHQRQLLLGITLTPTGLHHREALQRGRTGLKQPIAYSLARLARLQPGEISCDPMAGVGTIPIEAARLQPVGRHLAGDQDAAELTRAQFNCAQTATACDLMQWDATRLPLAPASVDVIVCDLPFGVRVGSHRKNVHLYPRVLSEIVRVLKPGGRAILLSLERRLMQRRIQRDRHWQSEARYPIHYGGLNPAVYCLHRPGS